MFTSDIFSWDLETTQKYIGISLSLSLLPPPHSAEAARQIWITDWWLASYVKMCVMCEHYSYTGSEYDYIWNTDKDYSVREW